MPTASYIDPRNGKHYPLDQPRWCSDERTPLLVTPGAGISREDIDSRTRSLWRYKAALPVEIAKPITLGEGCTPLVQQGWGTCPAFISSTCSLHCLGNGRLSRSEAGSAE